MPDKLQIAYNTTGKELYAVVRDTASLIWDGMAFVSYNGANLLDYVIALTEQGTSRYYEADFPATIAPGLYDITIYEQIGGSPSETDLLVGAGEVNWNGTSIGSGDPWTVNLGGYTTPGTAGYILNQILARIGAFTGTGLNTVLGFLRAIMRKTAGLLPSDVGGTYDNTIQSLEAQKDFLNSRLNTPIITIASNVPLNGEFDIIRGDDYRARINNAISVTDSGNVWPDGSLSAFFELKKYKGGPVILTVPATITPPTGSNKVATWEFTEAQTTALAEAKHFGALVMVFSLNDKKTVAEFEPNVRSR